MHRGNNPDEIRVGHAWAYYQHAEELHENDKEIVHAGALEALSDAFG